MLGIIDVREWQAVIDLATARPVERERDFFEPLKNKREFPYPEILKMPARWTIDAAEALVNLQRAGFPRFYPAVFRKRLQSCSLKQGKKQPELFSMLFSIWPKK